MSDASNGHKHNSTGRNDGENCRYCGAWSDAEWAKPCPVVDNKARDAIDKKFDAMKDEW